MWTKSYLSDTVSPLVLMTKDECHDIFNVKHFEDYEKNKDT
jgi:hypothetical protein